MSCAVGAPAGCARGVAGDVCEAVREVRRVEPGHGVSSLGLLHTARAAKDGPARSTLNQLLRRDLAARAAMARLMVDEQALIHRLLDDSIALLLDSAHAEGPSKVLRLAR